MAELLIDLYKTKDPYSGLGQFSLNFARAIIEHPRAGQRVTFLRPREFSLPISEDYRQVQANAVMRYLPIVHRKYDLWHSLHQFPAHQSPKGSRTILTVHDLNFLVDKSPSKAERYLAELQLNLDRAFAVTAISDYTRTQLEEHTNLRGKPVHVIHNGVRQDIYPNAQRPAFMDDRPFFFAIGVFKQTKNLHSLIPLMEYFPDHQLVIAGNNATSYGMEVRRLIKDADLEHRVFLPGTIDDQSKYWLYANCEAFLFPSMAEGFGMPVVEAMSVGAAVFLSRRSSIPEVGGDAASYFDDFAPESMATTIQRHLQKRNAGVSADQERMRAHAAQFNWTNCIGQYQDLYEQVIRA